MAADAFHQVQPLELPDLRAAVLERSDDCVLIYEPRGDHEGGGVILTIEEARALLEWLRVALP